MARDDRDAVLVRIRAHLAAFGCEVDDMSDDALEARIQLLGAAVGRFGVTVAEAMSHAGVAVGAFETALRTTWEPRYRAAGQPYGPDGLWEWLTDEWRRTPPPGEGETDGD